jgi:hypothetical protein
MEEANQTKREHLREEQDFAAFLEWPVDIVGGKESRAKGHFRFAELTIEEL